MLEQGSCAEMTLSKLLDQGSAQHDFYEIVGAGVLCSMTFAEFLRQGSCAAILFADLFFIATRSVPLVNTLRAASGH